jgi:hypothetical protein
VLLTTAVLRLLHCPVKVSSRVSEVENNYFLPGISQSILLYSNYNSAVVLCFGCIISNGDNLLSLRFVTFFFFGCMMQMPSCKAPVSISKRKCIFALVL